MWDCDFNSHNGVVRSGPAVCKFQIDARAAEARCANVQSTVLNRAMVCLCSMKPSADRTESGGGPRPHAISSFSGFPRAR